MGSFLFKWDHPATEVYVTGTFDNWAKSVKLEKKEGTRFERLVDLPRSDEKYFYKFVVDDKWTTDHMAPQETDEHHNTNNILLPENITQHSSPTQFAAMSTVTPASTTAKLAGQVPKDGGSSDLPGSFPETPALEKQEFGVNPLPATSGFGNPIHTTPGQALPPTDQYTSNNITSAVTLDKESYERGAGAAPVLPDVVTPEAERDANGSGMFGLPATTKDLIPESSLPMGSGATTEKDAGPFIQSSGAHTTTADLAGKVPLERSAVPEVVSDSQAKAGVDAEASANPEVVREKTAMENELESKVPEQPATSEGSPPNFRSASNGGVTGMAAGAAAGATAAAAGAAAYVSKGKIGGSSGTSAPGTAIASTVPDVVQESIAESHQSPEAAASKEMVREKGAVEAELLQQVKHDDSTGEHAPTATSATSAPTPKPTMKSTETPLSTSTISKWKGTDAPATTTTDAKATPSKPTDTAAGGLSPPATTPAIDDSRDVSPMTRPSGQPEVTTGVASSQTTKVSKPSTMDNGNGTGNGNGTDKTAVAGPSSDGLASSSSTATDAKKEKRKSGFFGKLKSRFDNRDKK